MDVSEESASKRNRRLTAEIAGAAATMGLRSVTEYAVPGGRVDVVWFWDAPSPIPGAPRSLPLVGFEIESSWRTRKHVKGDVMNLLDLGCSLGVIVLAGEGPEVESLRESAQRLTERYQGRIVIWTEADVCSLVADHRSPTGRDDQQGFPAVREPAQRARGATETHAGKYEALWRWLSTQNTMEMPTTFAEIEAVLGFPLPRSCYDHPTHWSGYDGSAVARAIHDAGWRASKVDLAGRRVVFVRRAE